MKILLAAINAKYIHSNPAIHSLKAVAGEREAQIILGEYTINHNTEDIRRAIYQAQPDVAAFSCYIWNISYVETLCRDLHRIMPKLEIWLGGPEVSYDAMDVLRRLPEVAGVMTGPGEETFRRLAGLWEEIPREDQEARDQALGQIPGIVYRDSSANVSSGGPALEMDLSAIPFWYKDMTEFENRIVYYESSRGCPFSCSYCLSSIDKQLHFRDLELVKRELSFFLERRVPQVKFIDRTFNCRESHALAIWQWLAEHDNGVTNFHFEIAADLLTEAQMQVLSSMRPGLVQLEIGVQSTNPETVKEIRRVMDVRQLAEHVHRVNSWHNIHQHLDLIAGLPYEDYESFGRSFDDVYAMEPEQLQLGFLKVLKGAYMERKAKEYGLIYTTEPPYEVMATRWLPYEHVLKLKGIEDVVEMYYNSGQFTGTLRELVKFFGRPFRLYEELAAFRVRKNLEGIPSSRIRKYEILLEFIREFQGEREAMYRELLTVDAYLRENTKNRPAFAPEQTPEQWQYWKDFLQQEAKTHEHFPEYSHCSYRELLNRLHGEFLQEGRDEAELWVFDYGYRDPLSGNAKVHVFCVNRGKMLDLSKANE